MAFQTKALLPYIEGILTGLTGMQYVARGQPVGTPPAAANAYVLAGGQQPQRKTNGGVWQRTGRFLVLFLFAVQNEPDDAEDALADMLDAFQKAILADPTAGGLTTNLELNTAPADNPEYLNLYGPAYRTYPIEVVTTQTDRF